MPSRLRRPQRPWHGDPEPTPGELEIHASDSRRSNARKLEVCTVLWAASETDEPSFRAISIQHGTASSGAGCPAMICDMALLTILIAVGVRRYFGLTIALAALAVSPSNRVVKL
jgi:hypothetical protein